MKKERRRFLGKDLDRQTWPYIIRVYLDLNESKTDSQILRQSFALALPLLKPGSNTPGNIAKAYLQSHLPLYF